MQTIRVWAAQIGLGVVVGAWLPARDHLRVFIFSLKAFLALRKLKKKTPHFLCSSLTTQKWAGTRDLLESLVVQTEAYCIPVAKGKSKLKLSLSLRIIRRSLEE